MSIKHWSERKTFPTLIGIVAYELKGYNVQKQMYFGGCYNDKNKKGTIRRYKTKQAFNLSPNQMKTAEFIFKALYPDQFIKCGKASCDEFCVYMKV